MFFDSAGMKKTGKGQQTLESCTNPAHLVKNISGKLKKKSELTKIRIQQCRAE
jgi:hypothetical protein